MLTPMALSPTRQNTVDKVLARKVMIATVKTQAGLETR
jgi:hypothetical protein